MPSLNHPMAEWLEGILERGESVQIEAPSDSLSKDIRDRLESAFQVHARDVAGTALRWEDSAGEWAAILLAQACWALANSEETWLKCPIHSEPRRPEEHLSADLTLRFLPSVHRRARARSPESELVKALEGVLCRWPLSGVLADLEQAPAAKLDFDGHSGLQLLYAERLVRLPRAAWLPPDSPALEWIERIFGERGQPLPKRPVKEISGE